MGNPVLFILADRKAQEDHDRLQGAGLNPPVRPPGMHNPNVAAWIQVIRGMCAQHPEVCNPPAVPAAPAPGPVAPPVPGPDVPPPPNNNNNNNMNLIGGSHRISRRRISRRRISRRRISRRRISRRRISRRN